MFGRGSLQTDSAKESKELEELFFASPNRFSSLEFLW
jgi:hypothetical protein